MAKKSCNKIKSTCVGGRVNSACVEYELEVNKNSSLIDESCLTIEETTQDIYNQLEEIDLSDLGKKCLEYVETEEGKIIVKNVLLKMEEEICGLKDEVKTLKETAFCDLKITDCGLNLKCLTTACNTNIVTVKDLFQALINKACP